MQYPGLAGGAVSTVICHVNFFDYCNFSLFGVIGLGSTFMVACWRVALVDRSLSKRERA